MVFGLTAIGAAVRVSVPAPRKVECSDQPPVWNLSLRRVWLVPSVQSAASAALFPCASEARVQKEMLISQAANGAKTLLPREIIIFGIPIWALGTASKIGLTLLRSGLEYVEKPRRKA